MARIGRVPKKIKMTKTMQASSDGIKIVSFYDGEVYDNISPDLLDALEGGYELVDESPIMPPNKSMEEDIEEEEELKKKNAGKAPHNKAMSPKENK
jgi:pyruvoyl-dependent arginine decarboxylase (PvlArgDC)